MARENQGLQIALIIFVTFTVALGALTYWVYRLYDEQASKAKTAQDEARTKSDLANKSAADATLLKKWIGIAPTENIEAIDKNFKEDMKKYGAGSAEGDADYRRLLEKLSKTLKERNTDLEEAKAKVPKLQDEYKNRVEQMDAQRKQFEDRAAKAEQDRASEQSKFNGERDRITREESKLQTDLQNARKLFTESLAKVDEKIQQSTQRIRKLLDANQEANDIINNLKGGKIGAFNGEITWVNQRDHTAWINLGRADALSRQVTFGVYAAGSTDVKQSKAGIEITQILGDHSAEARILDDNPTDPIIPGDKIFTPLWSPGEERHFALAGLMDVNGDGRGNLEVMLNIIKTGGGVVDCYIADSGKDKNKIKGAISVNTNCLILGPAPDEKGDPAQREAFTKILREADQYRLPKMQLADFLQRIGWKNMSLVVRYGRGANPNDFRARPDEGVVRKSTGNTSDVFKDREPPAPNTGRYYRF